jgi:hypothetical protein
LDTASIAAFEKDSVSFVRAMDLYGVSLRKGETPDEISRKGDPNISSFLKILCCYVTFYSDALIFFEYDHFMTSSL